MRPFQAFDIMNVADGKNGTATLGLCPHLISANTVKQGGHITMGVPAELIHAAMDGSRTFTLLAIDYAEYKRLLALRDPAEKLVMALKRLYKLHYEFLNADERAEYKQIIENYENDK